MGESRDAFFASVTVRSPREGDRERGGVERSQCVGSRGMAQERSEGAVAIMTSDGAKRVRIGDRERGQRQTELQAVADNVGLSRSLFMVRFF